MVLRRNLLKNFALFPSIFPGMDVQPFADTPETRTKRESEIRFVKAGKKYLMYPNNVSMMFADENLTRLPEELQRSKEIASRIPDAGIIAVLNGMMGRPSRVNIMEQGRVPCLWILGKMDNYIPCETVQ